MRRLKRIGIAALGVVLVLVTGIMVSIAAMVWNELPADVSPPDAETIPRDLRAGLWVALGGESESRSLGFVPLVRAMDDAIRERTPRTSVAQVAVPMFAAIELLIRDDPSPSKALKREMELSDLVALLVVTAWISAEWSADEALAEIAQRADFGHGFFGAEAAARGYFGRPVDELTPAELAAVGMFASRQIPEFSPWCHRSYWVRDVDRLLPASAQFTGEEMVETLLPPPEDAC